jgi:hypothetical protein
VKREELPIAHFIAPNSSNASSNRLSTAWSQVVVEGVGRFLKLNSPLLP